MQLEPQQLEMKQISISRDQLSRQFRIMETLDVEVPGFSSSEKAEKKGIGGCAGHSLAHRSLSESL